MKSQLANVNQASPMRSFNARAFKTRNVEECIFIRNFPANDISISKEIIHASAKKPLLYLNAA